MIDTSKSLIYNGSKKVDKIYHGTSSSPVYTWEVGEVVTGPETTHTVEVIYLSDPEMFPWESSLSSGYKPKKTQPKAISNIVNGRALGQAWGHFTEVVQEGVPLYHTRGTIDVEKPPFLYVGPSEIEYGTVDESAGYASSVYESRIMLNIKGYKWPSSSRVLITFRERATTQSPSIVGWLRIKSRAGNEYGAGVVTRTASHVVNSQGHPLRGIAIQFVNYVGDTEYNFIEDLHLPKMNGEIYDLKVYLEHGEIGELTISRTTRYTTSPYDRHIDFRKETGDDDAYWRSVTVTRVEFSNGDSISGNFTISTTTWDYRINLGDTIRNFNSAIGYLSSNEQIKITYEE